MHSRGAHREPREGEVYSAIIYNAEEDLNHQRKLSTRLGDWSPASKIACTMWCLSYLCPQNTKIDFTDDLAVVFKEKYLGEVTQLTN